MLPFRASVILLVNWLWFPGQSIAQLDIERTERLSLEQGLFSQEIRDIYCDERGFLWLATGLDLERYDGYSFEHYDQLCGVQRLHGHGITHISQVADTSLCLLSSHMKFIDLFHTDQLYCRQVFLDERNGIQGVVQAQYAEKRGGFFVLSTSADSLMIWRLHRSSGFEKVCAIPWENTAVETIRLLKSKTGSFWVQSYSRGLFHLSAQGKLLHHFDNQDFHPTTNVKTIATQPTMEGLESLIFYEDDSGRLWLSFKNRTGVYLFQPGGSTHTIQLWPGLPTYEYFSSLWEDQKGTLLFACPNPADKYTFSKLLGLRANGEQFDASALLEVEDKILDVFGDNFERQLFLGTYSGIYKVFLRNKGIHRYLARTLKPGEFGAITRNITGDGHGHVFFALEERNWYALNTVTDQLDTLVLTDARGKPLELTCSGAALVYEPPGYLWGMGCTDAQHYNLHRYDLVRKTTRTWPLDGRLTTFYRQLDGHFCLLFRDREKGGHMDIFDPYTGIYTPYTDADGANPFAERFPKYIIGSKIHPGLLWIGTNDGLVALDMQQRASRLYGTSISLASLNFSHPNVLAFYEDESGSLWIGTGGGGLNILSFDQHHSDNGLPRATAIKIVDMTHGLSNNQVSGLLPDGQGGCVLSTDLGLSYYHPASQTVGNFYKHDGLSDNEFNRFSFFKDENNRFYFGTINGLNAFYLPDLLVQNPPSYIRLTKLTKYFGAAGRLEEQIIGLGALDELVIEPEVSYFQLDFMLTDYAQPEKNRFSVWLEGQEKDWNSLGYAHTLRYNRLTAGQYTLHLRGMDAQGNWTKTPFSLRIRSEEFFYRTWWFLGLLGLLLVGAAALIAQWRIRSVRAEEKRRSTLNARLADLELRALQAQMNPHFIFNCLNSIQSFIAEGDKNNAMRYVTRFAQLTRAVLHFSGKTTISLDEELAALRNYIELECLRAGPHIQYVLQMAPDIVPFDIELPPMLVQPFVENAFKHGRISQLNVLFKRQDAHLVVTVQDDGVGLGGKTSKLHQSKGIAMTRERLAFWNGRTEANDLTITPQEKGLLITMTILLK